MAVVLVGAIFVGSIETVWVGEITPPRHKTIKVATYDVTSNDTAVYLERGAEMGRFNMGGSTVIVLFGADCVTWESDLLPETRVQFGQALAFTHAQSTYL